MTAEGPPSPQRKSYLTDPPFQTKRSTSSTILPRSSALHCPLEEAVPLYNILLAPAPGRPSIQSIPSWHHGPRSRQPGRRGFQHAGPGPTTCVSPDAAEVYSYIYHVFRQPGVVCRRGASSCSSRAPQRYERARRVAACAGGRGRGPHTAVPLSGRRSCETRPMGLEARERCCAGVGAGVHMLACAGEKVGGLLGLGLASRRIFPHAAAAWLLLTVGSTVDVWARGQLANHKQTLDGC